MVKFTSRKGPDYSRVIACLKRTIRDIVQSPYLIINPPSYITAPLNISQQGVKALYLDGGGVRGLSSLLVLRDLMYTLKRRRGLTDLPKPCDVFDVIAGTRTGGLIAIMIGRLRMDVDSCIIEYQKLSRDIFERTGWHYWGGRMVMGWDVMRGNSWFDPRKLEQAIMEILAQRLPEDELDLVQGNIREVPLLELQEQSCKTFVCAIDADTHECVRFRSYSVLEEVVDQDIIDCAVVDAARATSAAPLFFPTARIGTRNFFDGALKNNNPVLELIKEIRGPLGNPQLSSLVSIGTGKPKDTSHNANAVGIIQTLKDMVTDTEHHHHDVMTDHAYANIRGKYFRSNVETGLSEIGIDRWDLLPTLRGRQQYTLRNQTPERQSINVSACFEDWCIV